MNMKRIEAKTLEEAYRKASEEFNCSITEIDYQIIQYPTSGVMGLFRKSAIIVVAKRVPTPTHIEEKVEKKEEVEIPPKEEVQKDIVEEPKVVEDRPKDIKEKLLEDNKVLDSFFEKSIEEEKRESSFKKSPKISEKESPRNVEVSQEIKLKITNLMNISCFDINTITVRVSNNIAHIFVDGEDAALLIGKEGYRYNALSYMLFNWINARYNLYIKLEIAEFIKSQEDMIVNYLKPIIEHVEENGRGKTKPLDGILVQIALEQLRERFPNKYVAIKTAKDGRKFIIINNFNSTKNG
jgi:spoIIIJ-associated protein